MSDTATIAAIPRAIATAFELVEPAGDGVAVVVAMVQALARPVCVWVSSAGGRALNIGVELAEVRKGNNDPIAAWASSETASRTRTPTQHPYTGVGPLLAMPEASTPPFDRSTTLAEIVAHKREEVASRRARTSIDEFKEEIETLAPPRNFFQAVVKRRHPRETRVIAEIKRRSPSAGWIRREYADDSFDPTIIARQYHQAGAAAISCLTDERYFSGRLEYIHRVKDAVPLPVLRKDFIVDAWQLWESRAAGADAVLLIAECLSQSELLDLSILARELRLTTLVECHDIENLFRVLPHIGFPERSYALLGINNRDLNTMKVDLNHSTRLAAMVEDSSILVSESGIATAHDLKKLRRAGINSVLVGESLMREPSPGDALARMLDPTSSAPSDSAEG